MKSKFSVGQVVKNAYAQFGWVKRIDVKDGKIWVELEGDMWPIKYPESTLKGLTDKEKGVQNDRKLLNRKSA
jgi:hypothetical protein